MLLQLLNDREPTMFKVCVASYVGVIGQNAELCDVDNPRGLITGTILFLRLEDATGCRLAGPEVPDRERGERRAAALQRAIDKGFDPMTSTLSSRWTLPMAAKRIKPTSPLA